MAETSSGMSPETVGEIIAAMVIALIGGGYLGKRAATIQRVRLTEPMPEVPVRRVSSPPTWDQHHGLEKRVSFIEQAQTEMRRDMAAEFRALLEAGGSREQRLSSKLEGIAREIHRRIDENMKTCHERQCSPTTARK